MEYQDCVYHGVGWGTDAQDPARIIVEVPTSGPTERRQATVLRTFGPATEDDDEQFAWGYGGTGPNQTAAAVLADALELGQVEGGIWLASGNNEVFSLLRRDFVHDVVSQCCDEWRLRRSAILTWARGWYLQREIAELPPALR